MNKKTISWIIAIIIVVLVIISLTNKKKATTSATLNIGVISTLTGNAAYYGQSTMKGAEIGKIQAEKEHQDLAINLFHEDSLFTSKGGIDAYEKLKNTQNINALISQASNIGATLEPLVVKDNILYIAASTLAATFSSPDNLTFRVTAKADGEAVPALKYLESKNVKKLGVLYMNNEIGTSLRDALQEASENSSVKIVAVEVFATDAIDFKTNLLKLKAAGVDGMYLAALASHSSMILKQASDLKVSVPMISYRGAEDSTLVKNAGALAEGLVYTNAYDLNTATPENTAFKALYKEKYNEDPNAYAAEAYEAVRLIADTYAKCGDTRLSTEAITCSKSFLFSVKDRPTLFGPLTFDINGDVTYPFFIKTVKDGKFVKYENK